MSDLAELFARDPHQYSEQDIKEIVKKLREQHRQFKLGNVSAGKKKTVKETQLSSVVEQLSLKDLGI